MKQVPDARIFEQKAKELFGTFLTSLGYQYTGTSETACTVVLSYQNKEQQLLVSIRNETAHVDYGFSVFIWNADEEHNILYNVPWEKQDPECRFLQRAHDKITGEPALVDILSGKAWALFKTIYFSE